MRRSVATPETKDARRPRRRRQLGQRRRQWRRGRLGREVERACVERACTLGKFWCCSVLLTWVLRTPGACRAMNLFSRDVPIAGAEPVARHALPLKSPALTLHVLASLVRRPLEAPMPKVQPRKVLLAAVRARSLSLHQSCGVHDHIRRLESSPARVARACTLLARLDARVGMRLGAVRLRVCGAAAAACAAQSIGRYRCSEGLRGADSLPSWTTPLRGEPSFVAHTKNAHCCPCARTLCNVNARTRTHERPAVTSHQPLLAPPLTAW